MKDTPQTVRILGSGTSTGVPVIGCGCDVCRSGNPKNHRTRASIHLTYGDGMSLVVDTGPEFRIQMIREHINGLDAVLYTHLHADHCHGFDDLRALYFHCHRPVNCYLCADFALELQHRFAYAFTDTGYVGTKPKVSLNEIPQIGEFEIGGHSIDTFRAEHGNGTTSVFRFGEFAYATDFKKFTNEQIARWRGKVRVMVASGIHFGTHLTHSVVEETIELFRDLQVKRGVITHISHKIDHLRDSKALPSGVEFAYDGMVIDLI